MASRLIHGPSGAVLADRLEVARSPLQRLRGLLGRDGLPKGGGMLFERCASIHTCFMRFSLDVIYMSGDLVVRKVVRRLRPWRISACPGAWCVVELAAGALDGVAVCAGDPLRIEEA
jgi:hypothetical protein